MRNTKCLRFQISKSVYRDSNISQDFWQTVLDSNAQNLRVAFLIATRIMMMYRLWIIAIVLTYLYASDNVYASHFRGGVVMVKPKIGGAAKEVKDELISSYNNSHLSRQLNS